MRAPLAIITAIALGGSASAWGAEAAKPAACKPIAEFKALFNKDTTFTVLTLGQVHFAQGVYAREDNTVGAAPGTGALLIESVGMTQTGQRLRIGRIVWLKDKGSMVCPPMIGPYGPGVLGPLQSVKTGKDDEPIPPLGAPPEEGDTHL